MIQSKREKVMPGGQVSGYWLLENLELRAVELRPLGIGD